MKLIDVNKISEYVVLFCQNLGVSISPLKLQKLLYYLQSWHIAKFEKELLFDTLPEARVNDSVYREVYNHYKRSFFKNENILTNLYEIQLSEKLELKHNDVELDENQIKLSNTVLEVYGKFSDERLVLMTHSEAPRNEARIGLPIQRSERKLSVDTIYNYFNRK